MKTTSLLALALVALGMTAQASPNAAESVAASGSANIERVDYRCYYNCERQGRKDCLRICNRPGPDIPKAEPAEPTLHKRNYQCYKSCISRCHGDRKCENDCAWDCAGPTRPDPPMKRDTASVQYRGDGCDGFRANCRWGCRGNRDCIDRCNDLVC
ncbi:hypothetical protein BCR44DRAFT_35455 [Catenaria anguillulae PL171]|uniref:Uncharacterized protein n=1 Tax=Catenaria anguillulae PL171 TaxID=765915 RepID=A0A1Y2HMH7_9FUNG|nr:hypothetical protein BCR44DRAFT_35455 [Catenaria anguillulae PL171]